MQSHLIRYLDQAGHFKATLANTTLVGRDAHRRLQASPIAIQLVTQAMTAASMLASEFKSNETLSLKFQGDGPCTHITVEANARGEMRGFTGNLNIHFERDPSMGLFQQAIGKGALVCRRRLTAVGKIHTSTVPLIPGEMAANVAHYLLDSEQIHSAMALGAQLDPQLGIQGAGGILIQALPGADGDILKTIEDRLTTMDALGATLAQESGAKELERHLFENFHIQRVARLPLRYRCNCSRERVVGLLRNMPEHQLSSLLEGGEPITLQCQFCTKPFTFDPEELRTIADELGKQSL